MSEHREDNVVLGPGHDDASFFRRNKRTIDTLWERQQSQNKIDLHFDAGVAIKITGVVFLLGYLFHN